MTTTTSENVVDRFHLLGEQAGNQIADALAARGELVGASERLDVLRDAGRRQAAAYALATEAGEDDAGALAVAFGSALVNALQTRVKLAAVH